MGYDVSGLANYTDENKLPLLLKAQLKSKTASLLTLQTGVKGPEKINLLNVTLVAQARGCGFTSQGGIAFTQRTLTPAKADFKMSFCPADLEAKWTKHELLAGAAKENEVIPFEQETTDLIVKGIGAIIEVAAWQGDTASGSANLNKGDGLIKLIDASTGEIEANATPFMATPITVAVGVKKSNISSVVDAFIAALPSVAASLDDIVLFFPNEWYRMYVQAIKDANLFHYSRELAPSMEMLIPGTNYRLVAVDGLNGTNRAFMFSLSNAVYGVDLESDSEEFKIRYSEDNDEVRFTAKMNYAFQVAFPDEVVKFTLVP